MLYCTFVTNDSSTLIFPSDSVYALQKEKKQILNTLQRLFLLSTVFLDMETLFYVNIAKDVELLIL